MLGVSRAGFYEARRRFAQPEICTDSVHVRAVFAANQQCYGSRRMVIALRKKGLKIGRYRVRRLMCQLNLKPVWKRKFVHTTDSNHSQPVAKNILNREFERASPNTAYVTDITYIRNGGPRKP